MMPITQSLQEVADVIYNCTANKVSRERVREVLTREVGEQLRVRVNDACQSAKPAGSGRWFYNCATANKVQVNTEEKGGRGRGRDSQ